MATPRKHWFRVADSVLYEDWDHDVLAMMIKLCAHLNTRWAREGRTAEEAGETTLSHRVLHLITGRQRFDSGLEAIRNLARKTSISVRYETGPENSVHIYWPKYAEFQGLKPESDPRSAPKNPSPQDAPARRKKERTQAPKEPVIECPAELPEPHRSNAVAWAEKRSVGLMELNYRWQRVLRWSEQNPGTQRTAKGWYATLRNAVEDGWGGNFTTIGDQTLSPAQAKARRTDDAARKVVENFQRRQSGMTLIDGGGDASA